MGLFDFFKTRKSTQNLISCYSIDKSQVIKLYVDESTIYIDDKVIGTYTLIEQRTIEVKTADVEIQVKVDEFSTFINKTRNQMLAEESVPFTGAMLTGPMVQVNSSFIATIDDSVLVNHGGDEIKGMAAFICAHTLFFSGEYHNYFKI